MNWNCLQAVESNLTLFTLLICLLDYDGKAIGLSFSIICILAILGCDFAICNAAQCLFIGVQVDIPFHVTGTAVRVLDDMMKVHQLQTVGPGWNDDIALVGGGVYVASHLLTYWVYTIVYLTRMY